MTPEIENALRVLREAGFEIHALQPVNADELIVGEFEPDKRIDEINQKLDLIMKSQNIKSTPQNIHSRMIYPSVGSHEANVIDSIPSFVHDFLEQKRKQFNRVAFIGVQFDDLTLRIVAECEDPKKL